MDHVDDELRCESALDIQVKPASAASDRVVSATAAAGHPFPPPITCLAEPATS